MRDPLADLNRLGKRGAYRLGKLRAQGIGEVAPPDPYRVSFGPPHYRGRLSAWLLMFATGTAAIAAGAFAGLWFAPFVVCVIVGLATRLGHWWLRGALLAIVLMVLIGWGIPLAWLALHGQPVAATARVVAALAGLPGGTAAGFAVTLLTGLIQALAGLWLGRAIVPRR